ncbi:MAG: hypothetical protein WCA09_08120, partial [Burkholderiales bacterium]
MPTRILKGKKLSTVKLDWKEVFYTNCGMVSASNVEADIRRTRLLGATPTYEGGCIFVEPQWSAASKGAGWPEW